MQLTFINISVLLASCFCLPQVKYSAQPSYKPPRPSYEPPRPNYFPPQPQNSNVRCHTELTTVWETQYVENVETVCSPVKECRTSYRRQCRMVPRRKCGEVHDRKCSNSIGRKCHVEMRPEMSPYEETECRRVFKRECEYHWEGAGNDKVWVEKAGTCFNNPVEKCVDVVKQVAVEVRREVCVDVPEEKCGYEKKEECRVVREEVCEEEPFKDCEEFGREKCEKMHKKVPVRVSRRVPKKICDVEGVIAAKKPNNRGIKRESGAVFFE